MFACLGKSKVREDEVDGSMIDEAERNTWSTKESFDGSMNDEAERSTESTKESIDGSMNDEFESSERPKKFQYSELARCTNNFARDKKLGEGEFGPVYKGYLRESDLNIAIKRHSHTSTQGIKEYASEVKTISRIRYRHLVQLIGWCHEERELLLVYEFMPNLSLDTHLFGGKSHLSWPVRYKIVQDLASALQYLHEEWEQCVLHRDIKPRNILLDADFNAKLGDFGSARLVDHEKGSYTTSTNQGASRGYLAPEYHATGRATKETDVYSFGVVILEIVCRMRTTNSPRIEGLVDRVWRLYGKGNLCEVFDHELSFEYKKNMKQLLIVGLWCAHPENYSRPSIREANLVLNFKAPLPKLPPNKPVHRYY